ncbi:MAG: hypothetical protein FH751_07480 [Firmicutes bacterium]|nr:hypothetical protein [Bacillota bacterium]
MKINSIKKRKRNIFKIINEKNNNFSLYTAQTSKIWFKPWSWLNKIKEKSLEELLEIKSNPYELKHYLRLIK